ncbi:hypothetical protein A2Y85_00950 [candidate division WOR-3 bacterium RBG_13_43_14]|uniref:Lipoprotein n=1 Tax=candidate division WOR-3 bacterium RBG_13_43_14 TaxID=1802590 RepID=A0A1F4UD30_UNCW3|nr:MAG: hypothetical protein A2Y85_00950 [candidate division WOR-3 bacterium RBG_13_43_14]
MIKRYVLIGLSVLFVICLAGCGDKTDEDELREAENLVNGLNMMAMMTDVDQYTEYTADNGICSPPIGWDSVPSGYQLPDWTDTLYYEYTFPHWWFPRLHIDSAGVFVDSIRWLAMPEPDVWADDTLALTGIDTWVIGQLRNDIYFHTTFSIADSLVVDGLFKWNWSATWYEYSYEVSKFTEAASIDITTSTNIGLGAHFLFEDDGSGIETNCYAEWNSTQFVRYTFFAEPDPENNNAEGYYTLLSEAWKVRHYFQLVRHEQPVQ